MKYNKKTNELFAAIQALSEKEQKMLVNQIMEKLSVAKKPVRRTCESLVVNDANSRPDCPHCAAKASLGYIVKRGDCRGAQRYFCKRCGHYFVATTNTAFARSRKDADLWRKFIGMTISGKSLKDCSSECGIAYQTAFTWRHKILNAFRVNQDAVLMTGRVEIDEMQFPISYKGNHVKGAVGSKRTLNAGDDNGLPRKSFRRGSDNKQKSSYERTCVFCMVEDGNKSFYATVPGVGFMSEEMLDKAFAKHVDKESALVLADNYRLTKKYLEQNHYHYITLMSNASGVRGKNTPEIQGENHLQHVNAMHRHIRRFLAGYCGVSSKYLENYISLYIWIRTNRAMKQERKIEKVSITRAATADCYISRKDLLSLPAVPKCA